jgi:heat-inducible transcriptional repressor
VIRLNVTFTKEELEQASNFLNSEYAGKSLSEIRAQILELMHQEKALFDKLLQNAVILCSESIDDDANSLGEVFVEGTTNILTKKDFTDLERLRGLLTTIGERSKLLEILNECVTRDETKPGAVQVIIGSENTTPSLQNCTLITAPYRIGDSSAIGTLSVLGPTGMEYARMISIVSYVARVLERMMSKDVSNN